MIVILQSKKCHDW